MASTVLNLINSHSTNTVIETDQDDGSVIANFDGPFLPELPDDTLRFSKPANAPGHRHYRLYSEADGISWFETEISNIVLAAFRDSPTVVLQHQHPPKHHASDNSKIMLVDTAYTLKHGSGTLTNLAIGEFKRNLIRGPQWQAGSLDSSQRALSRELRGYAYLYECPQVFCFDHATLLLLQFRAGTVEQLKQNCEVDCWVFPRENLNGTSLRYALYRLLAQGFRRCQGLHRVSPVFDGQLADGVVLYSGMPYWRIGNNFTVAPAGYTRMVDLQSGACYWVDENGNAMSLEDGERVWDTLAFWS
ncbi:hypothetical protein SPI_03121 [Niveomyces insectorum RCEF 264]|uniref:Uncharacterized protein n=1 Tax=Niveomyces insectorum RCEF 264 TaxID=1081102 RepID=A0A167X332_9HYPO|nr:hypothetical protein SPI_03121 [Niveomyces insectorum RCEF 264]